MCRSVVTTSSVSLGGDARASPETAGSDNLPLDAANATKAPVPTQSNGAISRRQFVLLTVVFLDTLGVGLIFPLIIPHARSLGASPVLLGLISSAYGATQLVSSPLIGQLSDRVGRHRILQLSLLCVAASYLAVGASTSLWLLLAARVFAGLFKQSLSMCKAAMCDLAEGRGRSVAFGLHYSSSSLGFSLGPSISGQLAASYGIGAAAMLAAAVFAVNLIVVTLCMQPQPQPQLYSAIPAAAGSKPFVNRSAAPKPSSSQLQPHVLRLLFTRFLLGTSVELVRTSFSLLLEYRLQLGIAAKGHLSSYVSIVALLSQTFALAPLTRRCSETWLVFYASIAMGLAQLAIGMCEALPLFIAALTASTVAHCVLRTVNGTILSHSVPKCELGCVLGMADSTMAISRAVAPFIAGVLTEQVSMAAPTTLASGLSAAAAVWHLWQSSGGTLRLAPKHN